MNLFDKRKRANIIMNLIDDGEVLSPKFAREIAGETDENQIEIGDQEFPEELWSEFECADRMNQMSSERYLEDPIGWFNLGPW